MDPLSVRQLTRSVVSPTIRVPSHPGKLLMGVFDDTGEFVPGSELNRRAGEQGAPVPHGLLPEPVLADEPEAIYAGPLYFHFGHFLLESLARAWYARQRPDLPLVWAGAHTWQKATLKPWQTAILDVLGITQPTRIIADPTRFEKLHVPDIGYRYDDIIHPEHAAFLGNYDGPAQEPGTRLWLSRNKLSTEWRDLNAGPTERHLAAAGWTVVNPEQLTLREQLDHLSRAEVVAGEEGSAFHTIILLRDASAKRLEIFRRHGPEHRNMHTIGDAKQVTQRFHTLEAERVLEAKGRYVSKLNPSSAEILDVLEVPVPAAPASGAETDGVETAGVEQLLRDLAPRRLLAAGHTRLPEAALAANTAVAVSPRLAADPRSYRAASVEFVELDLAQYAEHFHDADRPFDIVWIEAAGFEEYMRSFAASKALTTDRAVWVLGTGRLAARVALAVALDHPGYSVERTQVGTGTVLTAHRVPGTPAGEADIAALSNKQVARQLDRALAGPLQLLKQGLRRRARRVLPAGLRRLLRRLK